MGQPTVATVPLGAPSRTTAAAATSLSHNYHNHPSTNGVSNAPQPTTLFQRLVTEEVQELKAYARIIENQNRRLVELERIHGDLESRLELEARGRTQLEATLERRERSWTVKYHDLQKDRDQWKNVVSQEQAKNAKLFDQVVRKDQDIHRMLQRKVSRKKCTKFLHNFFTTRMILLIVTGICMRYKNQFSILLDILSCSHGKN
jgi:hypothetical protein